MILTEHDDFCLQADGSLACFHRAAVAGFEIVEAVFCGVDAKDVSAFVALDGTNYTGEKQLNITHRMNNNVKDEQDTVQINKTEMYLNWVVIAITNTSFRQTFYYQQKSRSITLGCVCLTITSDTDFSEVDILKSQTVLTQFVL